MRDRLQSLIPGLVTYAVLAAATLSILASLHHNFQGAAQMILTAALLDSVDGTLARQWGKESMLGAQLDSLADLVAFGVAPAILVTALYFSGLPVMGALLALAFVVAAAYRLARFNVEERGAYFTGMSSTAAGAVLASVVLLPRQPDRVWLVPVVAVLALLMVSRLPYYAGRSERGRLVMAVPLLLVLVWLLPAVAAVLGTILLLGGVAQAVWRAARQLGPVPALRRLFRQPASSGLIVPDLGQAQAELVQGAD